MPTKGFDLQMGTITITDENGNQHDLGVVSDIEVEYLDDVPNKVVAINKNNEFTFRLKIPFMSMFRFKWEIFKAKRKLKKLVKALYSDGMPHEITWNFKP